MGRARVLGVRGVGNGGAIAQIWGEPCVLPVDVCDGAVGIAQIWGEPCALPGDVCDRAASIDAGPGGHLLAWMRRRPSGPPLVSAPQPPNRHGSAPWSLTPFRVADRTDLSSASPTGGPSCCSRDTQRPVGFACFAVDRCAGRLWSPLAQGPFPPAPRGGHAWPAQRSRACERNQRVVVCEAIARRLPPVADADDGFVRSMAPSAERRDRIEPCESVGCGGDTLGGALRAPPGIGDREAGTHPDPHGRRPAWMRRRPPGPPLVSAPQPPNRHGSAPSSLAPFRAADRTDLSSASPTGGPSCCSRDTQRPVGFACFAVDRCAGRLWSPPARGDRA